MYSKHYFVFFDKTNDFTIDEFGNIGRTMEDGPFNSNEIGRHVDTETIFMVRENAEKLVNAWEGLDVYYIGDNVIHLHGQPLGYVSIITPTTAWHNTTNRNAWVQTIKDYIWRIYNSLKPRLYTRDEVFWTFAWPNRHTHDFGWAYNGGCNCCPKWWKCKPCHFMNRGCSVNWNNGQVKCNRWHGTCKDGGGCSCSSEWDLCMQCADETYWQINKILSLHYDAFRVKWIDPMNAGHIYWLY